MNIIFVNILLAQFRGGGENFDLHIAKELNARGHEITFISSKPIFKKIKYNLPDYSNNFLITNPWLYPLTQRLHNLPFINKIPILRGFPRLIAQFLFEWRAYLWLKRAKISENFIMYTCNLPILSYLVSSKLGRFVIIRYPGPQINYFDRRILPKINCVIANGDAYRKIRDLNLKQVRLLEINVGIDFYTFNRNKDKLVSRKILNIDEAYKVLLFVGRLIPVKNVRFLFDVLKILVKRHTNVVLLIVGNGPQERYLKKYIKLNNLDNNVRFEGARSKAELPLYYSAADIFVLSSCYDNYPNVVLEAMACGLPVCATKVGGVPMQIENKKTGFLVANRDIAGFADSLFELIENEALRKKIAESAYDFVCKNFSWHISAEKLEKVIQNE